MTWVVEEMLTDATKLRSTHCREVLCRPAYLVDRLIITFCIGVSISSVMGNYRVPEGRIGPAAKKVKVRHVYIT